MKTKGATSYKNRPRGQRPKQVAVLLSASEVLAIEKLATMQEVTRSDVLRQALEALCRSALTHDEYRELYPIEQARPQ